MNRILFILFFLPLLSYAQKVSVLSVSESRSTQNSFYGNRCLVTLQITGDEVRKYKKAKVARVTKAMDEKGLDLIGEETADTKYEDIDGTSAKVDLSLLTTSRQATVIRELAGEIILFAPTEANGGLVKVKAFGKSANKNLVPKVNNLSVVYLNKESLDKLEKEQKSKKEAELKKQSPEMQALAKELMNLVDAFSYMTESPNEVSFFISGDENKLIDVSFETPSGTKIDNNGWSSSGGLKTYYFNEEVKPEYTAILTVESEGAVKKIPFSIKDVDLP